MNKLCIIVIGLPLSGKTTWAQNYLSNHVIYDDFITYYYNGNVKSKSPICIIDPRLCIPDIFLKYITTMVEYYGPDNIQLIMFENNPTLCLANTRIDNRKNIPDTIMKYTSLYNIDYECYSSYSKIILPIYMSSNYIT